MRFMMLVKADKNSEAGMMPDEKILAEMGNYNEQLVKAGVMLAGDGLQASSKGARVHFSAESPALPTGRSPKPRSSSPGTGLFGPSQRQRRSNGRRKSRSSTARSRFARCSSWRTLIRAMRSKLIVNFETSSLRSEDRRAASIRPQHLQWIES